MRPKTVKNILLALLLSLSLTLVVAACYTFYPVILLILSSLWNRIASQPESNGIAAVAGGVSESFLKVLVVVAPILFFIIFGLLQKRTVKS